MAWAAAAALLTVMREKDRGKAIRGSLATRLAAAEGDAMDLDELSYEEALELEEEIGAAGGGATDADGAGSFVGRGEVLRLVELVAPPRVAAAGDEGELCAICQCELGGGEGAALTRKLPCAHSFHSHCILPWLVRSEVRGAAVVLRSSVSCPLCKQPVLAPTS